MQKNYILHVEDDKLQKKLFSGVLANFIKEVDYQIITTNSGKEALEFIKGKNEISGVSQKELGLVLLDLSLPDISGMDILREIQGLDSNHKVPVIVLTAHEDTQLIVETMKLGASDYIIKGKNKEELDRLFKAITNIIQ